MKRGRKETALYAFYKGDEYVAEGTIRELADYTGLSIRTLKFYSSPVNLRRNAIRKKGTGRVVVRVE